MHSKSYVDFLAGNPSLREAALTYSSQGWFILPLVQGTKVPATTNGLHDAACNSEKVKRWWSANEQYNIGINLERSCLVVIDVDPRNGGTESLALLQETVGKLPTTYMVSTANGGLHYYYLASADFYENNPIGKKLAPGLEYLTNGYVVAPPSVLDTNKLYQPTGSSDIVRNPIDQLIKFTTEQYHSQHRRTWEPESDDWFIEDGNRDDQLTSIAGVFRNLAFSEACIEGFLNVIIDNGHVENKESAYPKVPRIAKSISKYPVGRTPILEYKLNLKSRGREPRYDDIILHGPLGTWVKYILPLTETHPVALLVQGLACMGNMFGAKTSNDFAPGFFIEGQQHRTNLYVAIVGDTAKAGKGDSWSRARELMQVVNPSWTKSRIATGVQTGEGIIDLVTDEVLKVNDEVVSGDKRVLDFEPEFGRFLSVASRQGNQLAQTMQALWDNGITGKVTASERKTVTDATVTVIAHITRAELLDRLPITDLYSGFANRFLWVHTKRTQVLPRPRPLDEDELIQLAEPLRKSLKWVFKYGEELEDIPFDEKAEQFWGKLVVKYAKEDDSPIIDAVTARTRPNVLRVATIYALIDRSFTITYPHLYAADKLVEYCNDSAAYIFSNAAIGDKIADKIMRALTESPSGLTPTELSSGVFNRNVPKEKIQNALQVLLDRGLIELRSEKINGRATKVYFIPARL